MEKGMKVINQFPSIILRSPLHSLLSKDIVLLTVRGRKTGKLYTTPVNYIRQGNTLIITTDSTWWKNLQGGAPVSLVLGGEELEGKAEVITEAKAGGETLEAMLKRFPNYGKRANVRLGPDGHIEPTSLAQALQHGRVLVRVELA